MTSDPFGVLRRPSSPHRPDPRFAAVMRHRLEEELGMNTVDQLQATTEQGTDLGIVHVKVSDADHAFAFYRELLGWQSEPYREGGFTAHYIVNTSVVTVLTDNPGRGTGAPVLPRW